jgi:hypothetical protein
MSLQMNYAVVILAFVFVVSITYWFLRGNKYYTGPRTHAHIVDGQIIVDDSDGPAPDQEKAIHRTDS